MKNEVEVEGNAGSKAQPKLTLKQAKFAAAYPDPAAANGNGTLAAKLAGYKGNNDQLAVQASVNLRNPKIQQVISARVDTLALHALDRLGELVDATKSEPLLNEEGTLIYTDPVPHHKIQLEAIKFLFELRSKCSVSAPEQVGDDEANDESCVQWEDLEEADRALIRQATEIEVELAEIDKLEDGGGDHGNEPLETKSSNS
jgi:hypothetical protein